MQRHDIDLPINDVNGEQTTSHRVSRNSQVLEYLKRAEVMLMMKGEMGVQNSGHGLERQEDLITNVMSWY